MKKYLIGVLIGLDQWANTILGGAPDETISSRAGRAKAHGRVWGRALCRVLNALDPGHCERAAKTEETGGHKDEVLKIS